MRDAKSELRRILFSIVATNVPIERQSTVSNMIGEVLNGFIIREDNTCAEDKTSALIEDYRSNLILSGKSEGTIAQYIREVQKFSRFINKDVRLATARDIKGFLAEAQDRGCSMTYLETKRTWLQSFYVWMENNDEIVKSPFRSITPIKCKKVEKIPFSSVELDKLRQACANVRERALLELLVSSGLRINEMIHVRPCDIDWQSLSIHVAEGKGGKERTTYMTEVSAVHLKAYLKDNLGLYLFRTRSGYLTADGARSILKTIGERAGVSNVHPHRCRRTFATQMVERGMPIQELQVLMGHSSIETTTGYVYQSKQRIESSYKRYAT